jgi:hypothetical protein
MKLRTRLALAAMGLSVMMAKAAYAVDVCSLLTTTEAAAALGVPEVTAGAGANRCVWTPKKYTPGSKQLTVIATGSSGMQAAKMPGRDGTAVSGIGDEAIQNISGGTIAVLTVRKGDTVLIANAHGVERGAEMEQMVARTMVRRLGGAILPPGT